METTQKTFRARRGLLAAAVAATAALALPLGAQAAGSFPDHPITLVVPFSPGGGTDIAARILATRMGQKLGQSVVVDNRAGAGGQIAADMVARAAPDGYTLLFANSGMLAINPWLYDLRSDPATSFAPVSLFADLPFALVVAPSVKASNVQELIALAKARPGERTFASSGTGGAPHLTGEIFQQATGTQLTHVPYKGGGPAMTDLMAGRVDMLFASILEVSPYVKAGKLRALVITGPDRSPTLPDVPTIDQAGVRNAQGGSWTAVMAPADTPRPVVDKLSALVREIAAESDIVQKLVAQGAVAHGSTPDEVARLAASERARYGDIIKARGLKVQ